MITGPLLLLMVVSPLLIVMPAQAITTFENTYPDGDATPCGSGYYCKGGSEFSSRSYAYRNCTDAAAYWAIAYSGVAVDDINDWSDARNWDTRASAAGYAVKAGNSNAIEPGDVAQSDAGADGHVGFVIEVNKNASGVVTSFKTAEYNKSNDGNYSNPVYSSRNSNNYFTRGSNVWDNFIDFNGADKGLGGDSLIVDTDSDGVVDAQDKCPTVFAKTANGCPKSDFNRDGRADLSAFYRMDNQVTTLWNWNGYANGNTSGPGSPWYGTGWEGDRVIQAGTGDFNNDAKEDVATFYRHDNGVMDLNIWYGDGAGGFSRETPWHASTGWEGSRMIPAGAGDFNKDGKADIAAFYRHDNNLTVLNVWWGNQVSSGSQIVTGPTQVWSGAGWDGSRIMPAGITDVSNDGKADIVTFYKHNGDMVDMNVWYGNGVGGFDLSQTWHRPAGSGWVGDRIIPAGAGDFNRDGHGDVAAFFRYDGGAVTLWIWYGQTGSTVSANPTSAWYTPSGWDGNRIMPAGVSDYNGDGKVDIATFYRHDNGMLDTNIWYDNGGGYVFTAHNAWHVSSGWEGGRLNPVKF